MVLAQAAYVFPIVFASVGCGIEPETLAALQDAVATSQRAPTTPDVEEELINDVSFTPPYPERNNPFEFPGQNTERSSVEPVTTETPDATAIEVLGFANVNQPRVLLRVGESTRSLGIGDRIGLIEVIGIRPPAVDLNISGQVRTVTMFDRP
ncbi:MAG: hypothetical protein AAGG48_12515 [Planctomycetota bacterium]